MKKALKKPTKNQYILLIADIIVFIATICLVGYRFIPHSRSSLTSTICTSIGASHQLYIQDDAFSQPELRVNQCDTITVINKDVQPHMPIFGPHEKHIDYPGYTPLIISKDEGITISALQSGTFNLHDHLEDKAHIQIIIAPLP